MEDSIIARIPLFERMSPEEREELTWHDVADNSAPW